MKQDSQVGSATICSVNIQSKLFYLIAWGFKIDVCTKEAHGEEPIVAY